MKRAFVSTMLLVTCSTVAWAQADEPGLTPARGDPVIDQAQRTCRRGRACAQFHELVRQLHGPAGPAAASVLGGLGDARAVAPMALLAVYGVTAAHQQVGRQGLERLAQTVRGAVEALARHTPDSAIRAVVESVLRERIARPADRHLQLGRVVYAATALPAPAGALTWTAYNLGLHGVGYAVNSHLELEALALLPVGAYAFLGKAKLMLRASEHVHLGLLALGGDAGIYIEGVRGSALAGGGLILTAGTERLLFNAQVLGGAVFGHGKSVQFTEWAVIPSLAVSARVTQMVRLNLEVYTPLTNSSQVNGQYWLIAYGVRFEARSLFGDVAFVIPAFKGAGDFLKYVPIGLPFLTIGYRWH